MQVLVPVLVLLLPLLSLACSWVWFFALKKYVFQLYDELCETF
jgi:hypothetical protein